MLADPQVIAIAISVLVAGALALFVLPHPCQCKHCSYHLHEHKVDAEKRRVREHRMRHHMYNIPWGDPICAQCSLGHRNDEPRGRG
jgi:hypothetical protein